MTTKIKVFSTTLNDVRDRINESKGGLQLIVFDDIDGNTYVLTHGRKTKPSKSVFSRLYKRLYPATLQAWKDTMQLRFYLVRKGLVSKEQDINLICCYGGMVRNNDKHTSIVNNTPFPCSTKFEIKLWGTDAIIINSIEEDE